MVSKEGGGERERGEEAIPSKHMERRHNAPSTT